MQRLRPCAAGLRRVVAAALDRVEVDGDAVGLGGGVDLAADDVRISERRVRARPLRVIGVAEDVERDGRGGDRLARVTEGGGALRLLRPEPREIAGIDGVAQHPLRELQVLARCFRLPVVQHDVPARQVRAAELDDVLRRLEKRDRAADVPERDAALAVHDRHARE
jgi:hypothetical protein